MINSIPACFYPTRKIILDDDKEFSDSMLLNMHNRNITSYNSSAEALDYLLKEYKPSFTKFDMIKNNAFIVESTLQHVINIDIEKIKITSTNPYHQDISVLLIDYHMPDIKGIDFLEKIQHLPIKYALITGEQNYQIAIDAFNSGLVHAYLRKDDPDFSNKIQNIVSDLEWKYFTEMSNVISNFSDFCYLNNPTFISLFKQFIEDHQITEFYLTHNDGNFTTFNSKKEKKYLLVRNKKQLELLSEVAKEDGGSSEIIHQLKQGKIIPFFNSKEYWQIPASEWDKFSYPATEISDDSNLLWSIINTNA